ncbi:MAG: gamma-glutamyl-gamma-aminobutyrate hydrolase family protein [Acidobacteriota bacterium]|nr:gamma-glutamyl-gamma-aminobutyrate hydrolase family protein [Acidobacteriota bacterium]
MHDYRPRIGITMRIELETDRFYLSRHYSEAVEAAGGAPLHISLIPNSEYIAAVTDGLDGILLPGSASDVDPLRYNRQPHQALGHVHRIKDETDLLVLKEIERRRLPLFGICFGMQILNVSRGGTLIQDIASQVQGGIKHEQGIPRDLPSHPIGLLEESRLASLAERNAVVVNSHHHQAIETVGRDLVASAWAADGLVEALEDPRSDRFVMAVQWHPELGWERDPLSRALFSRFVNEAGHYARTTHPQLVHAQPGSE